MNPQKELQMISRKDNLLNISIAFKKLLDNVSAIMHSQISNNNVPKSSLGMKKKEGFFRSRKNSLVLSSRRKNSYYSRCDSASPTKSLNEEVQNSSRTKRIDFSRMTNRQPFQITSRSKSQAINSKNNDIYKKIASYNQLLITKMFLFEDMNSQKGAKNIKDKKVQKNMNSTQNSICLNSCLRANYQSKIRHCQKNRRLHAVQKKQQQFSNVKQRCQTQFEPWETEKAQEFFYIAQ